MSSDKVSGFLEVGTNKAGEVVVNIQVLDFDDLGQGWVSFSPNQARQLANLLLRKADLVESKEKKEEFNA